MDETRHDSSRTQVPPWQAPSRRSTNRSTRVIPGGSGAVLPQLLARCAVAGAAAPPPLDDPATERRHRRKVFYISYI
jgi:hypothetical protein